MIQPILAEIERVLKTRAGPIEAFYFTRVRPRESFDLIVESSDGEER